MLAQSGGRFEAGLQQIKDGLQKPKCEKRHDQLLERLGRLKAKSRGASQHYRVNLVTDDSSESVFRSLKSELGLRPVYHQKRRPFGCPSVHHCWRAKNRFQIS